MIVKINKLLNKSIKIEKVLDTGKIIEYEGPAVFHAFSSDQPGLVCIDAKQIKFCAIVVKPEQIDIDGYVPSSVEEAVSLLNEFIGNFKAGGGSSSTTDTLSSFFEKIGDYNRVAFGIPEGTEDFFAVVEGIGEYEVGNGSSMHLSNNSVTAVTYRDDEFNQLELYPDDCQLINMGNSGNSVVIKSYVDGRVNTSYSSKGVVSSGGNLVLIMETLKLKIERVTPYSYDVSIIDNRNSVRNLSCSARITVGNSVTGFNSGVILQKLGSQVLFSIAIDSSGQSADLTILDIPNKLKYFINIVCTSSDGSPTLSTDVFMNVQMIKS